MLPCVIVRTTIYILAEFNNAYIMILSSVQQGMGSANGDGTPGLSRLTDPLSII